MCPIRTKAWHFSPRSPDILGAPSESGLTVRWVWLKQLFYSGRLPDPCGRCGARVSRTATVNCALFNIDLLLNIYVILKLMGGSQGKMGGGVMAWLTTGMFQHTPRICWDNAKVGHGGLVFSWLLLNELSFQYFRYRFCQCKLLQLADSRNAQLDHHDGISLGPFSMYALTCVTHVWVLCVSFVIAVPARENRGGGH